LTSTKGVPVNAVYGFISMIVKLMKEKKLTKKQIDKLLADAAAEQAALLEMRNAASASAE
jgi:5'-3' exonuclease